VVAAHDERIGLPEHLTTALHLASAIGHIARAQDPVDALPKVLEGPRQASVFSVNIADQTEPHRQSPAKGRERVL
jgi:hypothetical protein